MGKNKKEAAAYIGVSPRQLENYARQGRLSVRKEKGKTGDIAIFDDEELRQLKAEIDSKRGVIRGAVMRDDVASESPVVVRASASELSRLTPQGFIEQLAAAIWVRQDEQQKQKHEPTVTDIAVKPILKLSEAARLTGFGRGTLLEAHQAGS